MSELVPPPSVRARVLETARREVVVPRSVGARRRAIAHAAGFAAAAAVVGIVGPHAGARPHGYVVALAASWLVIAAVVTWAGADRGRSMLGPSPASKTLAAAAAPAALLLTWIVIGRWWPGALGNTAASIGDDARCVVMTFLLGAGPLLAFAWTRRGTDPVSPGASGAALGAAAGCWAAFALVILCDTARPRHILVGHLLPVAGIVILGALLGARVLSLRSTRG